MWVSEKIPAKQNQKIIARNILTNQRIILLYVWQSDIFHLSERTIRHFKCAKNSFIALYWVCHITGWTELNASQWIRILRHEKLKCLKLIKEINYSMQMEHDLFWVNFDLLNVKFLGFSTD